MFHNHDDEEDVNCFERRSVVDENADKPVINYIASDNNDILQAAINNDGILDRQDHTGENTNEHVTFKPQPTNEEDENENDNRFMPGERLLMSIQNEKPELLSTRTYKKITTKRKSKLQSIRAKLQ